MWARIDNVSDGELWETHRVLKAALVEFVRRKVSEQRQRAGYPEDLIKAAATALDPEALTIGFARRFATYKRANLIFSDMERLKRLLNNPQRPVQLVLSGKAHPADRPGQEILRHVHDASLLPELRGKILLIEDYDINVGRHLVQGVDVWLNNPRRPQEASGTSGQKVLLNGGLNCSVLDGWWAEAYDGLNGFAIGDGVTHVSIEEQDRRDGLSLFETLENNVVPLYYDRDESGRAAPLGRAHEAHDPHAGLAIQHRSHGHRLRAGVLHAGGGRAELRDAQVARTRIDRRDPGNSRAARCGNRRAHESGCNLHRVFSLHCVKEETMKKLVYGALSVLAFASFALVESKARATSPSTHAMNEKKPAAGGTMHQADLKNAMRKLWEDHIEYTRNFIISALAGLEDTNKVAERLLRNQDDIGDAIKPFYGDEAGKKLSGLLRDHILIAADIVKAAKASNNAGVEAGEKKWHANADDIAAFLAGANPSWKKTDADRHAVQAPRLHHDRGGLALEEGLARRHESVRRGA